MKTFINNHPFVTLVAVGLICGAAVKVAEIFKQKAIIDQVDIVVVKKEKEEELKEKVESVEE